MTRPHGSGRDLRGNTRDRRRRRQWMLSAEAGFGGNGRSVPCHWCGARLLKPEADRYPLCGHAGGRYVRSNVVPACRRCNSTRCNSYKQEVRDNDGLLSRERPPEREEKL